MFGIEFRRTLPTVYVMHFENGVIKRQGIGLTLLYFAPISTIVEVPLSSRDVPFVFQELTADFQEVTLSGQLTYRISEPGKIASLLDFSVKPGPRSKDDDPQTLLQERLISAARNLSKSATRGMSLREVLAGSDLIAHGLLKGLKAADQITILGVEILSLSILLVKPTPEMGRALEAVAREALQGEADQAIYARRNAAVLEERRIKESELNSEILVETKRRQIRETAMQADIALEEQRATLVDHKVENERKDSDSRSYALEASLKPLRETDWRTLLAVATKNADSRLAISLAFHELAENASKISQLNVSPDLLQTLLSQ